jgi:histidyl-tRNA synthetase
VFDRERIADYQCDGGALRDAGSRRSFIWAPELQPADEIRRPAQRALRGHPGSDEKAKGEVTIKDLIVGAELAKHEKGREQHLQKQAEAQFAVREDQLVEAVRKVLHGTDTRSAPDPIDTERTLLTLPEPAQAGVLTRAVSINGARQIFIE